MPAFTASPHPNDLPHAPRTVLVTGAGRRLGRAIALACARAGWRVAVHYHRSRQDALETVAACAQWASAGAVFEADLSDQAATRSLLPRVVAELGAVHAVVNSAALFEFDDAASFTTAHLTRHMHTNTAAPVLLAQALAAHLAERDAPPASGCVVNLLDQKLFNPNPDFLSYTLSKAALLSATTLLAQALAPRVRVVGVAPGLTLTSDWLTPERFEALHQMSPLGRSSTAEDVAASVVFALGNPSITGATLLVDGGQHLLRFDRDFSMMNGTQAPVPPALSAIESEAMRVSGQLSAAPDACTDEGAGGAAQGGQTLTLTGLRFDASLGILDHEKQAPQPIQVDAELNLGAQPLRPRDDEITHVLDYRKVRQIIIDECTAEHVNLLESLIGKLCERLLRLPGVLGVRVKIAKLEIFEDCEVAIRMEAGRW